MTVVFSWIYLNICSYVRNLHSCQSKKALTDRNAGFFVVFFFFVALRRCCGAGQIYVVVFGQKEEIRSGGMPASESRCWQKCYNVKPKDSAGAVIQEDLGDAHWPDQAGGCQCGETKETGSQNILAFALKLSGLHSKLYLEHFCHENIPTRICLFIAQKVFPSLCSW